MQGLTVSTCSSTSDGDFSFVTSFTDVRYHPATFNANYRSKISLYFLLLCGIIANGEIFKFDGGFCFRSFHLNMVANSCAAFSRASTWFYGIASSYNADEWGGLVTAASISSGFQSRPTETRHLTRAYLSNKCSAGCRLALHLGNTRPRNFTSMTPYVPVRSSSNRHRSTANAVDDLSFHRKSP